MTYAWEILDSRTVKLVTVRVRSGGRLVIFRGKRRRSRLGISSVVDTVFMRRKFALKNSFPVSVVRAGENRMVGFWLSLCNVDAVFLFCF